MAILIIYDGISTNNLIGFIDIFLELPHHTRDTLVHATPCIDLTLVHLIDSDSEVCGWLSYNQDLLVFNLFIHHCRCNQVGLNMILNECHRLSSQIRPMKEHGRRDTMRKIELERYGVVSWGKCAIELPAWQPRIHDGLLSLSQDMLGYMTSLSSLANCLPLYIREISLFLPEYF